MTHYHVEIDARDCDGRISRSYIAEYATRGEAIEMHEPNPGSGGTVVAGDWIVDIHEPTEEGYRRTRLTRCEDNCDEVKPTYRDHAAEAMGY